jgi:hypothetical protein
VLAPPKSKGWHRLLRRERKPTITGYIWRLTHRKRYADMAWTKPGYRPKWWRKS